jgi:hypothetical protein
MQKRSSRKWINPPCIITCFGRGVFLPGLLRTTIGGYAKFLVSVMHNENVNREIATERLTFTRNLVAPEEQTKAGGASRMESCRLQGDCRAGFGLADHSN